jgi:hypothetical protein
MMLSIESKLMVKMLITIIKVKGLLEKKKATFVRYLMVFIGEYLSERRRN